MFFATKNLQIFGFFKNSSYLCTHQWDYLTTYYDEANRNNSLCAHALYTHCWRTTKARNKTRSQARGPLVVVRFCCGQRKPEMDNGGICPSRYRCSGNHPHLWCARQRQKKHTISLWPMDGHVARSTDQRSRTRHWSWHVYRHRLALWRSMGAFGRISL